MDREWNDSQPIYRQLRDRVVAMILDGVLKEGDPLPSVRTVAADYRLNPLTVLKGYQELVDEELVEEGRILGLIGPNGAGKTTALNAILGLTPYEGELKVLGRDPWSARDQLMRDVSFIADVAVLPRWIRVTQALDYVAGVHPRFDRAKAESFLRKTDIKRSSKV